MIPTRYISSVFRENIKKSLIKTAQKKVVVVEWLRRQTRNRLGSSGAGSNPADYGVSIFFADTIFSF